jgi:hypothetical protein
MAEEGVLGEAQGLGTLVEHGLRDEAVARTAGGVHVDETGQGARSPLRRARAASSAAMAKASFWA